MEGGTDSQFITSQGIPLEYPITIFCEAVTISQIMFVYHCNTDGVTKGTFTVHISTCTLQIDIDQSVI